MSWSDGKESPGDSVRISGEKESHLDLGSVFEFDASRDFAVSVWVRPDKYGAIISRMDEADSYRGFDMLIMPDGRMNVHLIHDWPKNATKVTTKLTIPKKKWTHVVVVSQAPGMAANLRIFMNGRRVPFTTDSDTLNGSTVTKHPFWIGYRSQTPEFAGLISSLRIWTTTFADEAVASLFQETLRQLLISIRVEPGSSVFCFFVFVFYICFSMWCCLFCCLIL